MARLLLIDDDRDLIPEQVRQAFPQHRVVTAATGAEGLKHVSAAPPDVILLDLRLPDQSGLEVYEQVRRIDARIPVIFVTMTKGADAAIEAMKQGAYDYLFKPLDLNQLRKVVGEALEVARRMREPAVIAEGAADADADAAVVGSCPAMQEVYKAIGRVAAQDVPVLITGESGTGKELVARAVYQHGKRADKPFLALNCAAIPENLLESELFGHEKGAFTGADRRRIGKFEQVNGGTLFLDEIGDMPPALQPKILRLLQEQAFERVGGNETIRTDVRIIAATHRDLAAWSAEGKFRPDLYYRLGVFTIQLPPCASGATTCRCWCGITCGASAASWGGTCRTSPRRRWSACAATAGRATSGSCKACSSRPCCGRTARRCCRSSSPNSQRSEPGASATGRLRSLTLPARPDPTWRPSSANGSGRTRATCTGRRTGRWTGSCCPASWNTRAAISIRRPACWASPGKRCVRNSATWGCMSRNP